VSDEPLASGGPRRHQQDFRLAARWLRDEIRDLVRRRDVGAKRCGERVDQRVVAQRAIDVVSGDDAQDRCSEALVQFTPPAAR
jgi:hypothetical protein